MSETGNDTQQPSSSASRVDEAYRERRRDRLRSENEGFRPLRGDEEIVPPADYVPQNPVPSKP